MIKRYLPIALVILAFSGCSDRKQKEDDRYSEIDRLLSDNSDVIMDQVIVLDQVLLTLKDMNKKLSAISCVLDLTHTPNTH